MELESTDENGDFQIVTDFNGNNFLSSSSLHSVLCKKRKMATSLYTADNPVYTGFCFYGALLCLKVLMMAALTGRQRFRKRVIFQDN